MARAFFLRADGIFALPSGVAPADGDYGDITVSSSGATWTIDNGAVTYAKMQDVSATERVLGRISPGAGDVEELTGANLATILGSALASGANPTASVGLAAVNGAATTFLRSDGAPALSQSIAPVWTGKHRWDGVTEIADTSDSYVSVGNIDGALGYPATSMFAAGGPANNRRWVTYLDEANGGYSIGLASDAGAVTAVGLTFVGSGGTAITLSSPHTAQWGGQHQFLLAGTSSDPSVLLSSSRPVLRYSETDQGADGKHWVTQASGGAWNLFAIDDALASAKLVLQATRSANAITLIQYGNNIDYPAHTLYGVVNNYADGNLTARFDGANDGSGTTYVEWRAAGALKIYMGLGDAIFGGGSPADFAIAPLSGNVAFSCNGGTRKSMDIGLAASTYGNAIDNPAHTFYGSILANAVFVGSNVPVRVQAQGTSDTGLEIVRASATDSRIQSYDRTSAAYTFLTFSAEQYQWYCSGNQRLFLTDDGRFGGQALHNNAGSMAGTANQFVGSGTYTPTLTNVANTSALSATVAQWTRVGNVVTVSGSLTATFALAIASSIRISLPIASAFASAGQCAGVAASVAAQAASIQTDATNDEALFATPSPGVALTTTYYYTFTYVVV